MYHFDHKFHTLDRKSIKEADFTELNNLILLTMPRQSGSDTKAVEVQCLRKSTEGQLSIFGDGNPLVFPNRNKFVEAVDIVSRLRRSQISELETKKALMKRAI